MPKKQDTTRMLLVTDSKGRIIAATPQEQSEPDAAGVGIGLLPGQSCHMATVPLEIAKLNGDGLHRALANAKVVSGQENLDLGGFRMERREEK